jgi:hypothetical protein
LHHKQCLKTNVALAVTTASREQYSADDDQEAGEIIHQYFELI